MQREFNTDFKNQLWKTIADIEDNSQVEIVVIIRDKSENYTDIPCYWGIWLSFLSFTYVMFSPDIFTDAVIYLTPFLVFLISYSISYIPIIRRLSISKNRSKRNVEIMARALFQKGGLYHTQNKIGILIYVSLLEQIVYIVADRGIELAVPVEDLEKLKTDFNRVFKTRYIASALIHQLQQSKMIFQQYLPALEDDINELPNNLEINL